MGEIKTSRRNLLRLGSAAAAAAFVGGKDRPRTIPELSESHLPTDVLFEEELKRSGIEISQGTETRFYLRPGAFEFPLLRAAKEGKINGIEIAVIDAVNLDWRKTKNFSPHAREVFDSMYHPSVAREAVRGDTEFWKSVLENSRKKLADTPSESEERKKLEEEVEGYAQLVQRRINAINGSDDEFLDYYLNYYPWGSGNSAANFTTPMQLQDINAPLYKDLSSQAKGKYYIFLAVGGYAPDPQFSFPHPMLLEEFRKPSQALLGQGKYAFDRESEIKKRIPSFSIRHELSHYIHRTEDVVDEAAYESLKQARYWRW